MIFNIDRIVYWLSKRNRAFGHNILPIVVFWN